MDQKQFDEIMRKRKASINDVNPAQAISTGVSDDEFEKIMLQRRNPGAKVPEKMGLVEETARGIGRAPISIATTPFQLADVASSIGQKIGAELSAVVTGEDADQLYQEERNRTQSNKWNPLYWNKKLLDKADELKNTGILKGSESVSKDLSEGYKDPNWWMGNIGEAAAFSGILYKMAGNAIKKQGAKQVATLSDATATQAAKELAESEIKKIALKSVMSQSIATGAAMSHGKYRQWEKENPESATVLGDAISTAFGGAAGAVEGFAIGSHFLTPFVKRFGMDTGTKAATSFYKEVAKAAPKGFLVEGSTEGIQSVIENVGVMLGYDSDQELMDGVLESMVIGGAVGAGFGVYGAKSGKSGKDATEKDLLKVMDLQKKVEGLKTKIGLNDEILKTYAPDTEEYKKAETESSIFKSELGKHEKVIDDITKAFTATATGTDPNAIVPPGTDPNATVPPITGTATEAEAFGTRIDPTLTIEEIASEIDKGNITPDQWKAAPKERYTPEQVAIVDQHVEDHGNAILIEKMAAGEDITNSIISPPTPAKKIADNVSIPTPVVDGTKSQWTKLPDEFTDDDAIAALNNDFKITHPNDPLVASPSTSKDNDTEAVEQLASLLGVRVVRVSIDHKGGTVFNGMKSPGNDKVLYLNDKAVRPEMWVFGHEFSHNLEKINPDAYVTLLGVAAKEINPTKLSAYQKELDTRLGLKPGTTDAQTAAKEMLGDFVGDKFVDKNFWDKVYKENPTKFQQIVTSLKEYVSKILAKFGGVSAKSDKFFNDVVKMNDVLTQVINEHIGYTGAIEQLKNGEVNTGESIDLNADGKHWTHIKLGNDSSVVLRETKDKISIKRLSRPGSRRGSGLVSTSNSEDKGIPTAALNEIKNYAKKNNKKVVADNANGNPYLTKHGFINDGGDMSWSYESEKQAKEAGREVKGEAVAAPEAISPDAYAAATEKLEKDIKDIDSEIKNNPGSEIAYQLEKEKREAKLTADRLKKEREKAVRAAQNNIQKAKSEILDLEQKIKIEDDNMHISTSRDSILFSKEQIDKFEAKIAELESAIAASEQIIGKKDNANAKENEGEIRSYGQSRGENTGSTQNPAKSEKADSGNRNKQGEKGKEVKPEEKKIPKLADKIDVVVKEEEYKTIEPMEVQLRRITDTLLREGKYGDPAAFMIAIEDAGIKYDTVVGEVAFQEAFRRHMMAEENQPKVIAKADKKAAAEKIKKDKSREAAKARAEKRLKLNILTQMLTKNNDGVLVKSKDKLELGDGDRVYGESVDPKEYEAEVKYRLDDRNSEMQFARERNSWDEMHFSVDPDEVFISKVSKQIGQYKLDKTLPKAIPAAEWNNMLAGLTRNGKLHPEEVEYSYIKEWLAEQEGNVTREQILDYLQNNAPKVRPVPLRSNWGAVKAVQLLTGVLTDKEHAIRYLSGVYNESYERGRERYKMLDKSTAAVKDMFDRVITDGMTTEQQMNAIRNDSVFGRSLFNELVFRQSTDTERKLVLAAEYKEVYQAAYEDALDHGKGEGHADIEGLEAAEKWLGKYGFEPDELSNEEDFYTYDNMTLPGGMGSYGEEALTYSARGMTYYGTGEAHWNKPDLIGHYRYDDFMQSGTGEVVFTLLEVQSDWHADGKKHGYMTQDDVDNVVENNGWDVVEGNKAPIAPFKNTWPLLIFKNALIKAYNSGKNIIAWPSTEKQVATIEGWRDERSSESSSIVRNYLNVLPRQVGEFVKQYGGRVEKVLVNSDTNSGQHELFAVHITPEMKEMIENKQMMQFSVDPIDPNDPHPGVQEKLDKAKIVHRRTRLETIKNFVTATYKSMTSPFGELRPGKFGFLKDKIRLASEVDKFGSRQAYSKIYNIIVGLTEDEKQVFTMNLVLADILSDTIPNKHGIAVLTNDNLPFGYKNIMEVRESLRHFREQAKKSPKIMNSLAQRRRVMLGIQQQLISDGFLSKEYAGNDSYFHHQTIEKMALGDDYLFGVRRKTGDKELAWATERSGGDISSYSTDYIISEFGVISSAIAAIELNKIKKAIKGKYDVTAKLAEKAKGGKIVPPEGYTEWFPGKNVGWGDSPSYPDAIIDNVLTQAKVDPKVREQMRIASGMNEVWIIPEKAASALSRAREVSHESMPAKVSNALTQSWKVWMLLNPFRLVKYNINNMAGDVDIALAYDWRIMKYSFQAMKDIAGDIKSTGTKLPLNMQRWGTNVTPALAAELDTAHRLGVVGAGFVMHEITDVGLEFDALMNGPKGNNVTKFGLAWWQGSKDITKFRENILRLASYRYFMDRLSKGEIAVYGASNPKEINEITDINERAAKLSRELIGDYGRLSEGGKWIRKHMIPFYSWMEINAPRYIRMVRNLKEEGKGTAGAVASSLTWKTSVTAAKFMAFTALVSLWNNIFFGDDEDELRDDRKKNMHLLLGRNSDGSIRYLSIQGAFKDMLSWVSADNAIQDIDDIGKGEMTVNQKLTEAGAAPFKKLFNAAQPLAKMTAETTMGYSLFPNPTEPRPIKDKFDYVAKAMSVELIYRLAAGKPTKGIAEEFSNKLYWNVDPGESAYYHIREKVNEFNKSLGYEHHSTPVSDKSNALSNYKQALKFGDLEASEKYLQEYFDYGGRIAGIDSSIKLSAPTGGLRKKDRGKFYKSLDKTELEDLNKASKWYKSVYGKPVRGDFNNEP